MSKISMIVMHGNPFANLMNKVHRFKLWSCNISLAIEKETHKYSYGMIVSMHTFLRQILMYPFRRIPVTHARSILLCGRFGIIFACGCVGGVLLPES